VRSITSGSGDSMLMEKIDASGSGARVVRRKADEAIYVSERKGASGLKLVAAWALVLLPLAWGVYKAVQIAAPVFDAFTSRS